MMQMGGACLASAVGFVTMMGEMCFLVVVRLPDFKPFSVLIKCLLAKFGEKMHIKGHIICMRPSF